MKYHAKILISGSLLFLIITAFAYLGDISRLRKYVLTQITERKIVRIEYFDNSGKELNVTDAKQIDEIVEMLHRATFYKENDWAKRNGVGSITFWGERDMVLHVNCNVKNICIVNRRCFSLDVDLMEEVKKKASEGNRLNGLGVVHENSTNEHTRAKPF